MPTMQQQAQEVRLSSALPAATPQRLLVLADVVGATQVISFLRPLGALQSAGALTLAMEADRPEWQSATVRQAHWEAWQPTTLIFSRVTASRVLQFASLARESGVPVIFHLDDDLLDVPIQLGAAKYRRYHQPERLQTLRDGLNAADLVYASTSELADRLRSHGITSEVVAGDIYPSVETSQFSEPLPATGPVIGYMGTGGHQEDLEIVVPALIRLMTDMPTLRFETFGSIPPVEQLARFGSRYAHHDAFMPYEQFTAALAGLGWWIGLAPLLDIPFNRCKADTKWLEYSVAGVPVVASNLAPYRRAAASGGCLLADTVAEWTEALATLVRDAGRRRSLVAAARAELALNYAQPALARQVMGMVELADRLHRARAAE